MFEKILIANRGEIACRIIKTAHRMGVACVAVYSEADRDARHVAMADEAVGIGAAPAAESYLRGDRIVEACLSRGVQAVHPGYGFLSENAGFARALAEAGIVFIGPPPAAIDAMGDKIASKKLAEQAGVSTIPGFTGVIESAEHAVGLAREIGYPVMLKASAGGGGKGMRVAYDDDECRDGFVRATNEARASFGDERVFVEKFIEHPRHIEIQILGDGQGNVVHLGERECSIQRRHQKVIEEAPSSFLDETTRAAMGAQSVALARAVDYCSAGTVEFVVDRERRFYFLEMNTRLQVEHPVTELVTGLDLVEQMLRIAAGEPLELTQDDVVTEGWAIESRIYAEDPARGFLPSTGRLTRYITPPEIEGVRIDTGVYEGAEVSMYYDPMIAKLIGYGRTREDAVRHSRRALDALYIDGVENNARFLSALLAHPRFRSGDLSTSFIAEEFAEGHGAGEPDAEAGEFFAAIGACIHDRAVRRNAAIGSERRRAQVAADRRWSVRVDDRCYPIELADAGAGWLARGPQREREIYAAWQIGEPLFDATVDDEPCTVQVRPAGVAYRLAHGPHAVSVLVLTPRAAELYELMLEKPPLDRSRFVLSPMPGLLVSLSVAAGDRVRAGQELAVIEAMKMENVLRAERDGTVKAVLAEAGASLTVDQNIVEFE